MLLKTKQHKTRKYHDDTNIKLDERSTKQLSYPQHQFIWAFLTALNFHLISIQRFSSYSILNENIFFSIV